jgi:hypothetical protein
MGIVGLAALVFLAAGLLRAASRGFRDSRRPPEFGTAISLGVTAVLVGFLVSGLMEWNLGDEELVDLLYVLVGLAFATASWAQSTAKFTPDPN